ncbi:Putative microtubule-associated protein, MAP65/Ase1/PRC1 [Septoria linicola]|uniref:Microtubule-associated protein, MAP65/Ase1/PRC1 n=1 Tax=Septoria linicola TaxID=215465 RepID=A0A9Q9AP20_9PEZI|nr:putative microtubule-associated protein, MAP65/Ase1/PRC1 [Septoria linicola]USW49945.1 Putative microtubule-associated protein, MAP65/Ase1/PRC1 [Septoria linicola]
MDTSYLSQQVTTIIERLHGFFDEIGVASHERDSRESELFSALSETLHNQLNLVAKEKHELTEEAQRLIKTIRQMERSLDDTRPKDDFEAEKDGLKVTYPLLNCIERLKQKHHTIAKLHRERYEQVKKLVEALESYASHLEPSFVKIKLPPTSPKAEISPAFDLSPTYVTKLDNEFTRVYDEYNKRVASVAQYGEEIINLYSELGVPQAQIDSQIVQYARESPEQLGLHKEDLQRLSAKREKLVNEKQQRERKLKELRAAVEGLWDRLGVDGSERKQFLAGNRGVGIRQINEFEDELARLNELKKQNLHIFVEDARFKLQALWDGLYFSEEEMLDFAPAFSDVYSDALLSAHEQEIARLEALREQRAPILAAVDRHRSLIKDREDLEKSSQDASRLMSKGAKGEKRDPGKLLREEKQRKRITKELPKVEADLRKTLEDWEDEYGRPFCVHGQRYLDELDEAQSKAPPPRSKTPNALSGTRDAPKSAGRDARPNLAQSKSAGTLRGGNPTRSKTPTAHSSRNPLAASTTGHSALGASMLGASMSGYGSVRGSPSKIPGASGSRLPMGNLPNGSNSPERRGKPTASQELDLNRTLRGNMGPPRAPPPKMKDIFVPPTPTPMGSNKENGLDLERPGSVLRHLESDDPYDDRRYHNNQYSSMHSSSSHGSRNGHMHSRSVESFASSVSRPMSRQEYPVAPAFSRQTSNTSSIMSGSQVSGSENWETYDSNSENDEADATEAYYAKAKHQQSQMRHAVKRPGTASSQLGGIKRIREQPIVEEGREGSEAGWTDDGSVGETY